MIEGKNKPYNNLKGLLAKNDIRQSEMAQMVGMDSSSFSQKINRKNGRDFKLDESVRIAKILDVKIDDFF